MKKMLYEIGGELKLVLFGKSLDILLPPIVFLSLHSFVNLLSALIGSLVLSTIFMVMRLLKKENWYYSVGGFLGVVFAIIMVYINNNASNFFLPDIITTSFLIVATITSLILKKPLAIWVSHITRGWELEWFNRNDVKPAYTEVTIFWLGFFVVRLIVEMYLYLNTTVNELTIANIILGYPVLIVILIISYVYGITRLRKMQGPGVDEYREGKEPPYKGQTKGF